MEVISPDVATCVVIVVGRVKVLVLVGDWVVGFSGKIHISSDEPGCLAELGTMKAFVDELLGED